MEDTGFHHSMSVRALVSGIEDKKYLLPSIQRNFVWKTDRIIRLFDSLMCGYPISSFLFWEVNEKNAANYQFYEFIQDFDERTPDNNQASPSTEFKAVLDGQQRMTSLYIGLKGSYTAKVRKNFKQKYLYLNLSARLDDLDKDLKYDFKFLAADEIQNDENNFWFKVGDILDPKFAKPIEILKFVNMNETAADILSTLYNAVTNKNTIGYYLETAEDLDKVTNIFIRVNSGGMKLDPSDLCFSFATANLHGIRNIHEDINKILASLNGSGDFNFDKVFVLRAMLVLTPKISDIKFKPSNFNKENMLEINKNLDEIKNALELAAKFIHAAGFGSKHFKSNNSVIPLAQYIFNNPQNYEKDKAAMLHWFIAAAIVRIFSAHTDGKLAAFRKILNENPGEFPLQKMLDDISKNNLIDKILKLKYKINAQPLMALHLIFPRVELTADIQIDHIFPQTKFKNDENCHSILNLQLLTETQNKKKGDKSLKEWFAKEFADESAVQHYKQENCIPDAVDDFKEFLEAREILIRARLEKNLAAWNIF